MPETIEIKERVFQSNQQTADALRKRLTETKTASINVMGTIGAGKTILLEEISERLTKEFEVLVINGDCATTIDADRIAKRGVRSVQINVGKGCHLNAQQIEDVLNKEDLENLDIVFIENVGNLICPSNYDVGAHYQVAVISATEGPYVVKKHPIMFKTCNLAVLNKADLSEAIGVDLEELADDARTINPSIEIQITSAVTGEGIDMLTEIFQGIIGQI